MAQVFSSISNCIEHLIAHVGADIRMGIPLGIGKPNSFVNALYEHVKNNKHLSLALYTALSLEKPVAKSTLEKRFVAPFSQRVFGNYPDLTYIRDRFTGKLPTNITVTEFFLKSGDYLNCDYAQQHYLCSNYTHVPRDMMIQNVNVLAQCVAVRQRGEITEYSLSTNSDLARDVINLAKKHEYPLYVVLMINRELPFMENDAIITADEVDAVIDCESGTHTLFSAPNSSVSTADYAIGLHVSRLVKDGGTLQIGIGSLGDAIAQALILRDQHNASYIETTQKLGATGKQTTTFEQGLYGCSEMFVNGFMQLIEAGIIKREVYDHAGLQFAINQGVIAPNQAITIHTIYGLVETGIITSPLREKDVAFLVHFGIFNSSVQMHDGNLYCNNGLSDINISANLYGSENVANIERYCLGKGLRSGTMMHGGFILGPRDFYQKLRQLTPEMHARINMTSISRINQLYGHQRLSTLQRRDTCFVNTCMMMTLLGAAISDGLESGKLVSGVGGQYNFVAQAHEIEGARLIMMLRATRSSKGKTYSNIVWNYGHTTIPRQLRDMVATEYGVADLRGQTDNEIIKRLLAITDSRFQQELLNTAKANGKIEKSYTIPASQQNNTPAHIKAVLSELKQQGFLPEYPFGTDFTEEELAIINVLQAMKGREERPTELLKQLFKTMKEETRTMPPESWLIRLGLDNPQTLKDKILRELFIRNC